MLQQVAKESGILPPALANRPELPLRLQWAVTHFNYIAYDRGYGSEVALKLTTAAIELYRCVFDVECEKLEFHRYIRMVDDAWYRQMLEKRKKAMAT
jgi:hypothetical protein